MRSSRDGLGLGSMHKEKGGGPWLHWLATLAWLPSSNAGAGAAGRQMQMRVKMQVGGGLTFQVGGAPRAICKTASTSR